MKKIISATLIIGGIAFILGAAGLSDCELISFGEIIVRCIIGICAIGGGYAIGKEK